MGEEGSERDPVEMVFLSNDPDDDEGSFLLLLSRMVGKHRGGGGDGRLRERIVFDEGWEVCIVIRSDSYITRSLSCLFSVFSFVDSHCDVFAFAADVILRKDLEGLPPPSIPQDALPDRSYVRHTRPPSDHDERLEIVLQLTRYTIRTFHQARQPEQRNDPRISSDRRRRRMTETEVVEFGGQTILWRQDDGDNGRRSVLVLRTNGRRRQR